MCAYNHEELATVLVLVVARVAQVTSVTLSLLAHFHLVLIWHFFYSDAEKIVLVNNVRAHTVAIFSCY